MQEGIKPSGRLAVRTVISLEEKRVKPPTKEKIRPEKSTTQKLNDPNDWKWQMRHRVKTLSALRRAFPNMCNSDSIRPVLSKYPMAISPYYLSLIREPDASDPIFRQCVPQPEELHSPEYCQPDPFHEQQNSPIPQLIHRYKDRALSLASFTCAMYCRHCTRKRISGTKEGYISKNTLTSHVEYLRKHPEIREIIISGGDPLTMSTDMIDHVLSSFRSVPSINNIRIGTRVPVTLPMRITDKLCAILEKHHPIWLCTHFNHPREITQNSTMACEKLLLSGIPILNQIVLLKGVNDSEETMIELCRGLLAIRVRPHYLYQCDLVEGVEHFRTPLTRGIQIIETVRRRIGGIGVPEFMLDTADGGGKIPVNRNRIVTMGRDHVLLRNLEEKIISYPEPIRLPEIFDGKQNEAKKQSARIALVFNTKKPLLSTTNSEAEYDELSTTAIIANSIESLGHTAILFEANSELPLKLATSEIDLVFNIAESYGSRGKKPYIPALCEMIDIPYTGSDQTTLSIALDNAVAKSVLIQNGIPTPSFQLIHSISEAKRLKLRYPVIVKPNQERSAKRSFPNSIAWTNAQVIPIIKILLARHMQPAIVEEYLPGRELTVGIIGGHHKPELLPLLEIRLLNSNMEIINEIEFKRDPLKKIEHICPCNVTDDLAESIKTTAIRAYQALSCRDLCSIDIRLNENGNAQVIEIHPLPMLTPQHSDICKMTEVLGWNYTVLISKLITPALNRLAAKQKKPQNESAYKTERHILV